VSVSVADRGVGQGRVLQPRALIVTIYGLYAREAGGWVSVSALIRLMSGLGVDEPAVRSSISRLKRRGILHSERQGGVAGYALSDRAREILDEGDRRIFERPRATSADGWVLAVFSVPESQRQRRHMLRSKLTWLGFGTVSAGVWVAPGHLEDETRDVLERNGLAQYVDLFHGDYLGFGTVSASVAKWWDLDGLERLYADFVAAYSPVLAQWRRRRRDDGRAFADYVDALTAWRRLPFLDPGLPPELLPKRWSAARAADVFQGLRDRLEAAAHRHAESVTGLG
jgi:phenylacetic acid degradation operon negative regulatory protein